MYFWWQKTRHWNLCLQNDIFSFQALRSTVSTWLPFDSDHTIINRKISFKLHKLPNFLKFLILTSIIRNWAKSAKCLLFRNNILKYKIKKLGIFNFGRIGQLTIIFRVIKTFMQNVRIKLKRLSVYSLFLLTLF